MQDQDDRLEQAAPATPSAEQSLRQQAEEITRENAAQAPENIATMSLDEAQRLLHELRVHQVELELQNEELRCAQLELQTSRAEYFDLYDLAPVGYVTLSEQGLILNVNHTAAALLGRPRGQLVKQLLSRFIVPEDGDAFHRYRRQLLATAQPQVCELRMARHDGTRFWARLEATVMQDGECQTPVCRVTLSDNTARKHAEAALQESEDRFRSFFELSADPVCIADVAGRFRQVNAAFSRVLGYSEEELLGKPYTEFIHPDDRDKTRQVIEEKLKRGETVLSFENRYVRKDGGIVWLEWTSQPSVAKARTFAIARDTTERKQAEAELALDALRIQTLLDLQQIDSAPPEQLLDFVLEACRKITQSEYSLVGVLDEAESVLTIQRWSKGAMAQCMMAEKPVLLPLGEAGLWRDCVRQRQPLLVNDYAVPHPSKKGLPEGHVPIRRFLAVPIFLAGRTVAVAAVANKAENYTASDSLALTSLTNKLELILSRKRAEAELGETHELLRRRATELEAFNQAMVGREQRIIEMKEEVNALCRELGREPKYLPVWRKGP